MLCRDAARCVGTEQGAESSARAAHAVLCCGFTADAPGLLLLTLVARSLLLDVATPAQPEHLAGQSQVRSEGPNV